MANDPVANEDPFKNMIGTENDINHIMSNFVDSEDEIMNFCESRYINMWDIESAFRGNQNEFVVLSLNIQSIKAKLDNFFAIINRLSSLGIFFGAICLQKHGSRPTQTYHYYICQDITLFTKATFVQNTENF